MCVVGAVVGPTDVEKGQPAPGHVHLFKTIAPLLHLQDVLAVARVRLLLLIDESVLYCW